MIADFIWDLFRLRLSQILKDVLAFEMRPASACVLSLSTAVSLCSLCAAAPEEVTFAPIPAEVSSTHLTVTIGGEGTPVVHAALKGDVSGVTFWDVDLGAGDVSRDEATPLQVIDSMAKPKYSHSDSAMEFDYTGGLIKPGSEVTFKAPAANGMRYHWMFGDGTAVDGAVVRTR